MLRNERIRLRDIQAPIRDDIRAFNRFYPKYLRSGVLLIDKVSAYLVKSRGKGIRPLLTLLSSRASGAEGTVSEETLTASLVVELIHAASLVHDDVVDKADERRGRKTINIVFNNKVAVLFGDFLLSRSLDGMFKQRNFQVLDLFSECSTRLAKGELVEAIGARRLDLDKESYFQMVSDKTASLISAACQMGAYAAGKGEEYGQPLREYGELLGIAFQIRDDLLDFGDGGPRIGKPIGLDLGQAKLTLPLIHTLEQVSPLRKRQILTRLRTSKRAMKKGKRLDLTEILELITVKGGIEYSRQVALDYAEKAIRALDQLPESVYRETLKKFAIFVAERDR